MDSLAEPWKWILYACVLTGILLGKFGFRAHAILLASFMLVTIAGPTAILLSPSIPTALIAIVVMLFALQASYLFGVILTDGFQAFLGRSISPAAPGEAANKPAQSGGS